MTGILFLFVCKTNVSIDLSAKKRSFFDFFKILFIVYVKQ